MNIQLLLVSCFICAPLTHAKPGHACGFDAKHINEKSNMWPFDNYGKIFNVDNASQRFEFLKNTVYDDDGKNIVGRSRNCVHWSKDTIFIDTEVIKDFGAIKSAVVRFKAANDNEAKKLSQGNDFAATAATVFLNAKNTEGIKTAKNEVVGQFTPNTPRSGTIQINSKPVKVTMTKRRSTITTHKVVDSDQIKNGYWSARISGAENNEKFVAQRIELTALPDPREGDDPKLPRLLVIGDSISMNYGEAAKEALKGVVNYHRNEGNSFSSNYGAQYADYWLGNYTQKGFQWDVIHFNHGLHDLKQTGPGAPYATPLEKYKAYLRKEIEVLKKTGATLVFCTTTPVPKSSGGRYGRQKGAEVAFNKAALEVMKEYPEIQINDLCKVVNDSAVFDKFRTGSDVHYYKEEEQKVLGNAVANAVKKALQSKK